MRPGISTLLAVFAALFTGLSVVAVMQSQTLFSVYRNQSAWDKVISGYNAESEIYDVLARFLGGYSEAFSFPFEYSQTLDDGTQLEVVGTGTGEGQRMVVTARRSYALNRLELTREVRETAGEQPQEATVVLVLDCSSRMNEKSDANCTGSCSRKIGDAKSGSLQFVNSIVSRPVPAKFKLGIAVFRLDTKWVIEPTEDMDAVKDAVHANLREQVDNSPACQGLLGGVGEVSLGSGLGFANDFLEALPDNGEAKSVILVSSGRTNSRIPHNKCLPSEFCPADPASCANEYGWNCAGTGPGCRPTGVEFLRCTAADEADSKATGFRGIRKTDTAFYAVSVDNQPGEEEDAILRSYANRYYNSANATILPEIMKEIFGVEVNRVAGVKIRKVIPTALP